MSVSSIGVASGLPLDSIVSKLMAIESQPLAAIQQKQTSYNADVTAYGALSGVISAFQSSLTTLSNPATFNNLTATSGDASIASATTTSVATAGTYSVNVTQIAQGQSISSAGQTSSTNTIGTGQSTTVTFQFGTISGGTSSNGVYTGSTFTQDASQATGSITIDSSNNSLQGIRDAINNANIGVKASIIGDGSATPYHLVLASTSTGATSSMKISVNGDSAVQNLLANDPSGTQNFKEINAGQSANLTINGIAVTSNSNNISSSIQGVTLKVGKVGTTTVSIAANTAAVTTAVNSFVTAYNNINSTISQLTSYNATTKTAGALLGDPTVATVQDQLRSSLSNAVNGLGGKFTYLAQIGITFQKDGSIAADATKLQTALTNNFTDVGGLFAAVGQSTDSLTRQVGSTTKTQAGNYALNVTQVATQGSLTGNTNLNSASTTIAANTSVNVTLDGITAAVSLPAGNYNATQLASLFQSAVNGTSAFSSGGLSLAASIDSNGFLNLSSGSYGSKSFISLANGSGTDISALTGTSVAGFAGKDVAGTLNGVAATGNGQILTGASGSASDGLQVIVNGGATGDRGTVYFSQGFAYKLNTVVNNVIGTGGLIPNAITGFNSTLKDLQKQTDTLNTQLKVKQAAYEAQYSALDTLVASMQSQSSFLTSQLGILNGTTNK
ncbi:flagellar filament capping protein FliD [Undibacterium sp. SXout20W]|uniref:flagellar filament capping protein FliD n=1 Tax=Undibacterium sp. SXout20W TaxID=3413051 RepID=UPI003BF23D8D